MIEAKETEYKGYRFRSRLEARWAVFFDAIGARWEYEPEGFILEDGTHYLPDFLVHDVRGRGSEDMYIEVKGNLTPEDLHKVEMFPLPIIIFGQIPDAKWCEWRNDDGKMYAFWSFDYNRDDNEWFYNLEFSEDDHYRAEPKAGRGGGLVLDYPDDPYDFTDDNLTEAAFRKARQARFEHGERPDTTPDNSKSSTASESTAPLDYEMQRAAEVIACMMTGRTRDDVSDEEKQNCISDCERRIMEIVMEKALALRKKDLRSASGETQLQMADIANALSEARRKIKATGLHVSFGGGGKP